MGQWLISFYFVMQIGFTVKYQHKEFIVIDFPFININIGLTEQARGIRFFKDPRNQWLP